MSITNINYGCLVVAFVSFVLNLTANSADAWWISRKKQEFERVGLWQICFNHYRHRFDFYGKIYTGCWWIFSPETRQLLSWVSTTWFQVVQGFCTMSMLTMLLALILIFKLATDKELSRVSSRYILATAFVTLTSGIVCSFIYLILVFIFLIDFFS
jgi:hypothetical protein